MKSEAQLRAAITRTHEQMKAIDPDYMDYEDELAANDELVYLKGYADALLYVFVDLDLLAPAAPKSNKAAFSQIRAGDFVRCLSPYKNLGWLTSGKIYQVIRVSKSAYVRIVIIDDEGNERRYPLFVKNWQVVDHSLNQSSVI